MPFNYHFDDPDAEDEEVESVKELWLNARETGHKAEIEIVEIIACDIGYSHAAIMQGASEFVRRAFLAQGRSTRVFVSRQACERQSTRFASAVEVLAACGDLNAVRRVLGTA